MAKPTKTSVTAKPPTASTSAIPWPAFSPPSHPLQLTQLYPGLLTIDAFLPKRDLTTWLSFLTSPGTPIVLQPSPPKKRGEASRTNDRFGVQDAAFAEELWTKTGLKEVVCGEGGLKSSTKGKEAVGLNPNIRLYRYEAGAYFGRTFLSPSQEQVEADQPVISAHYDDDFFDPATKRRSEWTLLVYLTGEEDGVVGGGTAFYPVELPGNSRGRTMSSVVVPLLRGSAVLHQHGASCMLHEGVRVDAGVKWVVRSDVMFG